MTGTPLGLGATPPPGEGDGLLARLSGLRATETPGTRTYPVPLAERMRREVFAMKSKPRKRRARRAIGAEEIVSANECTGLVPALPGCAEGQARLARLYRIHAGRADS